MPVAAGTVEIDGVPLAGKTPEANRSAGVAAVPEGHRLLSGQSVEDNLHAAGFQHTPADAARAVEDVFAIFPELAERKTQRTGSMSGGRQLMLVLGQGLVARPKFILVDEMSLGLAPLIVKRLTGGLVNLTEDGVGVLLIEQFTALALKNAVEVHVMSRGRFTLLGEPHLLNTSPDILHKAYLA
ncbi:ATP-binding cassette domain-containing protein [Pelagibacterium halotolerans]